MATDMMTADNESSQDSVLAGILIVALGLAGIGPVILLAHELLDAFMPQQLIALKVKFLRLAVNLGILDSFDDDNKDNTCRCTEDGLWQVSI
jgi:hypothetical protein